MSVSFDPKFIRFSTNPVTDSLSVNISTLGFDWDMTPQGTPVVGVTSNASWTCAWDTNADFSADTYSGTNNGSVTISCVGENYLPANLTDTLRFFIDAVEYASVEVTQYQEGV